MRRKMKPTNRFQIKFKNEYTQYEGRTRLNTTLRTSIYNDITELSILTDQPISKMLDVLFLDVLKSQESIQEFIDKVRNY